MTSIVHVRGACSILGLAVVLLAVGCRSLPDRQSVALDIDQAVPGPIVRERYAPVIEAMRALDRVLSHRAPDLTGIPIDRATAHGGSANTMPVRAHGMAVATRRSADRLSIGTGPWQRVHADLVDGRLEYRSVATGEHVSVTVRPATGEELIGGTPYVVTDLLASVSTGDLGRLSLVERERQDLLGQHALSLVRQGRYREARPLIEQGIIRYPDTPLFFNLASVLFEQAARAGSESSAALAAIVRHRFDPAEVRESRRTIERFLNETDPP